MTSPAAPSSFTIASDLHGPRVWRRVEVETPAGRRWRLVTWESTCVVCGGAFTIRARASSTPESSHVFTSTTCALHRMRPFEVSRLRAQRSLERRKAVFEEIRRGKLAGGE